MTQFQKRSEGCFIDNEGMSILAFLNMFTPNDSSIILIGCSSKDEVKKVTRLRERIYDRYGNVLLVFVRGDGSLTESDESLRHIWDPRGVIESVTAGELLSELGATAPRKKTPKNNQDTFNGAVALDNRNGVQVTKKDITKDVVNDFLHSMENKSFDTEEVVKDQSTIFVINKYRSPSVIRCALNGYLYEYGNDALDGKRVIWRAGVTKTFLNALKGTGRIILGEEPVFYSDNVRDTLKDRSFSLNFHYDEMISQDAEDTMIAILKSHLSYWDKTVLEEFATEDKWPRTCQMNLIVEKTKKRTRKASTYIPRDLPTISHVLNDNQVAWILTVLEIMKRIHHSKGIYGLIDKIQYYSDVKGIPVKILTPIMEEMEDRVAEVFHESFEEAKKMRESMNPVTIDFKGNDSIRLV